MHAVSNKLPESGQVQPISPMTPQQISVPSAPAQMSSLIHAAIASSDNWRVDSLWNFST